MLNALKEKSLATVDKIVTFRNAAVVSAYGTATSAFAASGSATGAATKLGETMSAILAVMPIISKIAGIIIIIGGLWALYTHYKSAGREGSIAAGIAGIGVGAGLFFLSGLLTFGADTVGITATSVLPTN